MTFETIKSFILVLLVAVSILLTFSLWTYQPQNGKLSSEKLVSEEEMDIEGKEQTTSDVVKPLNVFFHYKGETFGFNDLNKQETLYKDMQSWVLYDFGLRQGKDDEMIPKESHVVELVFPEPLPMKLLNSLFSFNEEPFLPEWSFQHMYITFSENETQMNVQFESVDGDDYAQAVVNNSEKYDMLWNYATEKEDLQPYMKVEAGSEDFYMPKESIELYNWQLTTDKKDPNKLVNALFNNPDQVNRNVSSDESQYTDGLQGMRVDQNRRHMEFYSEYDSHSYELMPPKDILKQSLKNINEHNGWTDDYRFWSFQSGANKVRYRMFYDNYPIFNTKGYSQIKQVWRDNELYTYSRPLFSINNQVGATKEVLPSGQDVIEAIQTNRYANYDMGSISGIVPGYKLTYQDNHSYVMTLKPVWYMEYNGEWTEVNMGSEDLLSMKGRG